MTKGWFGRLVGSAMVGSFVTAIVYGILSSFDHGSAGIGYGIGLGFIVFIYVLIRMTRFETKQLEKEGG